MPFEGLTSRGCHPAHVSALPGTASCLSSIPITWKGRAGLQPPGPNLWSQDSFILSLLLLLPQPASSPGFYFPLAHQ